jgi:hypothetical protein
MLSKARRGAGITTPRTPRSTDATAPRGASVAARGRPQAELANIKQRLSDLADDVLEEKVDKGAAAVAGCS